VNPPAAIPVVTVLAVALLAATGCALQPPRSGPERAADAELAARVAQTLASDAQLYARHIDVDARAGVVRLSGWVYAGEDLYEARRVARSVAGVVAVADELELMVGGRTGSR
jgi:osmotically-inducible protein OsmY